MILILSKRDFETSTEQVICWLKRFKANFIRLNGEDLYDNCNIKNGQLSIHNISIDQISIIWYRRWYDQDSFINNNLKHLSKLNTKAFRTITGNIAFEKGKLKDYLFNCLRHKNWTSQEEHVSINKLNFLELSKKNGLHVPEYLITTDKVNLLNFIKEAGGTVITKPISEITAIDGANKNKSMSENLLLYTQKITTKDVFEKFPNKFHFSFFQKYIKKEYEIRLFYYYGEFFPMAIFSQKDDQTMTDYRNYNKTKPNRRSPIRMPSELLKKIKMLLIKNNYNEGSLDIIKSTDSKYYILELNPVGQFGMVSRPCNYNIEKIIAQRLIHEDKEYTRRTKV